MSTNLEKIEKNMRVGQRVQWPVDLGSFVLDSGNSTIAAAYPTSPNTYPHYWNPCLPYLLWNELPPGYPGVLCAITVPPFCTDLSLAREAANRIGLKVGDELEADAICDLILTPEEN